MTNASKKQIKHLLWIARQYRFWATLSNRNKTEREKWRIKSEQAIKGLKSIGYKGEI